MTTINVSGIEIGTNAFSNNRTIQYINCNNSNWENNSMAGDVWNGGAFRNCKNLREITHIDNNVTSVAYAFSGCSNLSNAPIIPNSVTNMANAFKGCTNLTDSPVIPNSVISLDSTFSGCSKLENVQTISNSVVYMNYAFSGCKLLKDVPELPLSVKGLSSAFAGCSNLTTAPDLSSLNGISSLWRTFNGCTNLTTAPVIPMFVNNAYSTFDGCTNLTGDIYILSPVVDYSIQYCFNNTSASKLVHIPFGNTLTHQKFKNHFSSGRNGVSFVEDTVNYYSSGKWYIKRGTNEIIRYTTSDTYVTVPTTFGNITNITFRWDGNRKYIDLNFVNVKDNDMSHMFYQSRNVAGVNNINENVVNMAWAFSQTNVIYGPLIPNNVEDMACSFYWDGSLITPPDTSNCTKIKSLAQAFDSCSKLQNSPDMSNITNLETISGAFNGCSNLTYVSPLPGNLKNMAYAFWGCSKLKMTPDMSNAINVEDLSYTFYNCFNLIDPPILHNKIKTMYSTFYNCYNLTNAPIIPNSVTNMSSTFYGCRNMTDVISLPNQISSLGSTFSGCSNLVNIPEIPDSVTTMSSTFSGCSSLTGDIFIHSENITITTNCFYSTTATKNVYIPMFTKQEEHYSLYCYDGNSYGGNSMKFYSDMLLKDDYGKYKIYIKNNGALELISYEYLEIYDGQINLDYNGNFYSLIRNSSGDEIVTIPIGSDTSTYTSFKKAGYSNSSRVNGVLLFDIDSL